MVCFYPFLSNSEKKFENYTMQCMHVLHAGFLGLAIYNNLRLELKVHALELHIITKSD